MPDVKQTLVRILSTMPGVELAYLFGSHAAGRARADSDVDVAVRMSGPLTAQIKIELIERIAQELGCPVDVVDLYDVPEPVTDEVMKGVRLVGSDAAHAQLLFRHLLNVADFLPIRQSILEARRRAWTR